MEPKLQNSFICFDRTKNETSKELDNWQPYYVLWYLKTKTELHDIMIWLDQPLLHTLAIFCLSWFTLIVNQNCLRSKVVIV